VLTRTVSWRWCLYVNVVAGLVALVYGPGNAASAGWTDGWTIGSLVVGVVLVAVFVLVERRVPHPLMPVGVLLDRDRGTAYLAIRITGTGSFAVFLFLTYYLAETLHFTPIQSGLAFVPMLVVPVGCLLGAIGMALLTGISTHSTYAGGVLPALLVLGLGLGLVFGPAQNAATSGVDTEEAGVASAMVNTAQQIGGSIGTAVFSALASGLIMQWFHRRSGPLPRES
jgi:Major Facilitator Superfamily